MSAVDILGYAKKEADKITQRLFGKQQLLGFDIRDTHLKIALLQVKGQKGKQDGVATGASKVLYIDSINIKGMSDEQISLSLLDKLKNNTYNYSDAVLVIPTNLAITTTIQIPSVKDDEIRDILNLQAGRHTPYSREEIVVDYINLGTFQDTYTKALVVMVTRKVINRGLHILEMAGLSVSAVYFAAEGIGKVCAWAFKAAQDPAQAVPQAVLNIDIEHTQFDIFSEEGILFTRNIPIGLGQLSQDKERTIKKLIEELNKSFESYKAEDISQTPKVMHIANSGSLWSDLYALLIANFKLEVKKFNLGDYFDIAQPYRDGLDKENSPSFTGLLASLVSSRTLSANLIPEEVKLSRKFRQKGKKIITMGILIMVVFFQICLIFVLKVYVAEKNLQKLNESYEEKIQEANYLRTISELTRVVRSYLSNKGQETQALEKLYDILPDEIYLKRINIQEGGNVLIEGTSESMSRIFEFVTELENNRLFMNVKTEYTENRKEKDKDVADFGIKLLIEAEKETEEQ